MIQLIQALIIALSMILTGHSPVGIEQPKAAPDVAYVVTWTDSRLCPDFNDEPCYAVIYRTGTIDTGP